ncbi:MAG: M16 family metallopeptidase [Prochlorothrix sp.]
MSSSPSLTPAFRPFALPQILKLPSGITLIHQFRPSPTVVADVWVKAGAAQERPDQQGMAHFLEHLIFKGSGRLGPGEFDQLVENQGGVTNAATSYDYAHFFVNTAVSQLPEVLAALGDLLLGAELALEEIDREREVVLEEIRQAQDNPDWVAFQHLLNPIHGKHPYGRSLLGTPQHLRSHTATTLRQFYQHHYQASNFTVVVVGGMALEDCRKWVDRSFTPASSPQSPENQPRSAPGLSVASPLAPDLPISTLPPEPSPPAGAPPFPPRPTTPRWTDLYLPQVEHIRVVLGWRGPSVQCLDALDGEEGANLRCFGSLAYPKAGASHLLSNHLPNGNLANLENSPGASPQPLTLEQQLQQITDPGNLSNLGYLGNLAEILALELWSVILAAGRSSPWVQVLREERQWVQGISTNFLQQRQSSLFSVNIWPEADHLEAVIAWICADLQRWQTQLVEQEALKQAKRLLRHEFIFATETHGQLAGLYGYYGAIARVEWSAAYFAVLEQMQPETLRSVLSRYLSPQSYTAIALRPPTAPSSDSMA